MKITLTITTPEVAAAVPVALLSGPFERKLETAAELGYDGVELMTTRPETLDAAAIRALLERSGLEAAAVSSGAQASLEKMTLLAAGSEAAARAFARLDDLISFAAETGAPVVTIGSFRGRVTGEGGDAARNRLIEILRRGAQMARERGVKLALEPLNRYEADLIHTVGEGLALVEAVGEPNLGLLFDTYHANIEEASLHESARFSAASGRLWHVHLGDSNRLAPGQGHIDFPGIFDALRAAGYAGYCSAELLAVPDPHTAAAQTITYWKKMQPQRR